MVDNYPWSGYLGRVAEKCLYCGRDDSSWRFSSAATHCYRQDCPYYKGAEPIHELWEEYVKDLNDVVDKWCLENNIKREDYEQSRTNYPSRSERK